MKKLEYIQEKKFNSLTKYPSIMTYHKMEKGCLSEELTFPNKENCMLRVTEKIDGTNTRIIILNDDYVIGSRDEFIYAKGDRVIASHNLNHVLFMKKYVEELLSKNCLEKDTIYCIYGELFGSHIQKSWKRYTLKDEDDFEYRIFDIWTMNIDSFEELYENIIDANAAQNWRENNKQPWWYINNLRRFCKNNQLLMVPYCKFIFLEDIPIEREKTYEFLKKFQETNVNIDGTSKQNNNAEGIVIKTDDRDYIVKLRFEDYEKTFRKKKK